MKDIMASIAYGAGVVIAAIGVLAIPLVIWGLLMMAFTFLVTWVYASGLQGIIDGPDIGYWPMFFTLWLIGIVIGLFQRA